MTRESTSNPPTVVPSRCAALGGCCAPKLPSGPRQLRVAVRGEQRREDRAHHEDAGEHEARDEHAALQADALAQLVDDRHPVDEAELRHVASLLSTGPAGR
jgi:hypothetical protein